jgi:hypothetical protein
MGVGIGDRFHGLPRGQVAVTDVARFAALHHVVEGAHGLLDGRVEISAVDLVEVDVVQLQTLQAGVDGRHDVAAGQADLVHSGSGPAADLGRDDDLVARPLERGERRADMPLRFSLRIDVRRVDEVHAGVERRPDERLGLGRGELADASQYPFPPKVIVPRHSSETYNPVLPK